MPANLPPILLKENGEVSHLEVSGTVLGLFDGATYCESMIAIGPGDIFVAFTDGVTEPENESGEFGEERLIEDVYKRQARCRPRGFEKGSSARL